MLYISQRGCCVLPTYREVAHEASKEDEDVEDSDRDQQRSLQLLGTYKQHYCIVRLININPLVHPRRCIFVLKYPTMCTILS